MKLLKLKINVFIIIFTFVVMGWFQLEAAAPQKEIPIKVFSSAFKHVPGLDKDAKVIIQTVRKTFHLYYKEDKDRKYNRAAIDAIDEDNDGLSDFLIVYFLHKESYRSDITRITLGKDYEFLLVEDNYKPGPGESSTEREESYACDCPDDTVEILISTCETGIPTAVEGVNTSYDYAVNAGYTARKLLGNEENTTDINNWLCCPNLLYWGRIGHGSTTGIYLDDGVLSYTYFNSLEPGALQGKVLYFNSCQVFNDPLKSSILGKDALKFIGGICNLWIGPSEKVFKCWNLQDFNQVPAPAGVTDEMCYWSEECESSTNYPDPGCHGCGGPGSVFPEPGGGGGTYYTLTVNTVGQGTVSLDPSGGTYLDGTQVTLTANPSSGWNFDYWSGDLTGTQNPTNILMDADKNVTANFISTGPASITVISPNGGESWKRKTTQTIQWTSTGTIANVKILYSANGGSSWITITSSTANDGSYTWTLPNLRDVQCLVKVASTDGSVEDVSDSYFTITKR